MSARIIGAALLVLTGCQQGQKGDTGAQGPAGPPGAMGSSGQQGTPGPQGPPGDAGAAGPAGVNGAAGQVVVLVAADGGSVVVDGGIAIVSGPTGPQGLQGASGTPGQALFIFAADGGTAVVDGGVVIVAGPAGPRGPSGGIRVRGPDAGVWGFLMGPTWFWDLANHCFMDASGQAPPTLQNTISYETSDCSGRAFVSSSIPAANGQSLLTRCFYLPTNPQTFARAELPFVARQFTVRGTRSFSNPGCQIVTPTPTEGFALVALPVGPNGEVGGMPSVGWTLDAPE